MTIAFIVSVTESNGKFGIIMTSRAEESTGLEVTVAKEMEGAIVAFMEGYAAKNSEKALMGEGHGIVGAIENLHPVKPIQ
jgi:hypothetical protein